MLWEASDSGDPEQFQQTELFQKCRDIGIIPGSVEDLLQQKPDASPIPSENSSQAAPVVLVEQTLPLNLKVSGMWCLACAWVLENMLKKYSGITEVSCNFSTDRLRCAYDPVKSSPDQIIRAINRLGYQAAIPGEEFESRVKRKEFIRFAFSAFLTANVMMLSFALYSGFFTRLTPDAVHKISWPIFIFTSIVVFYGGAPIYRKARAGFFAAAFGMETLITIGAFSAYLYSIYNLFSGSIHLYFDTACMLITLTLLGKTIERKALSSIQEDLENFFSLMPTKVKLCSEEFPEGRYVSADVLREEDAFMVEAGEIVPADGLVLEGTGSVDESSLTGEARPVQKEAGSRIRSGTHVLQGVYRVRAEGVGENSILGQMILIMEKALKQKTPLEGKTDRILRLFVPMILVLAAATGLVCLLAGFTFETALIRSVTIMVIACPCALGIAIPIARVAGISQAEKNGVLVRDFTAFEQADKIDAFVFDKTGTLTHGNWSLLDVHVVETFVEKDILALAAGLETHSDHYIAAVIRKHAEQKDLTPAAVEHVQCYQNGVSGLFENNDVKIGSKDFVGQYLQNTTPIPSIESKSETIQSTVYMSCGERLCALFLFGDTLRPGASATVAALRDKGYNLALVSGDGEQTTRTIGNMLGIENATGDQQPQDKAFYVQNRQKQGQRVAMVGDGVNDAPALVQSDLAVAVHSGSHLGKEAADITLMRGSPEQILDYLDLAKLVNKKIHQNLLYSFLYNTIGIPIAMSGLLTPLVAVSAMLLSSLSVIGNTLLLKRRYETT
jgi:heavy metal translocating P-type ATPase